MYLLKTYVIQNRFYEDSTQLNQTMNNINVDTPYINLDGDSTYNIRKIIDIPFWYHAFVCSFLIIMGVLGASLNGFIIWNFFFQRVVSETFTYDSIENSQNLFQI